MFGQRFTKDYGDTPNETWREALSGLTFEQAAHAIKESVRMGDTFPPTLAQFCYRAKSLVKVKAYTALPKPTINAVKVADVMAKAKKAVKKKGRRVRSVMLPGENPVQYETAKAQSNLTGPEFEMMRMAKNGWTEDDERKYIQQAKSILLVIDSPLDKIDPACQQIKHPADKSDPDRPETGRISGNDPAQKQVAQARETLEGKMI